MCLSWLAIDEATCRNILNASECLLALMTFDAIVSKTSVVQTIRKGKRIERSFQQVAKFVDTFNTENNRDPTILEIDEWRPSLAEHERPLDRIIISHENFPIEATEVLGSIPKRKYLLSYWQGDWYEFYAPWSSGSTVATDPSDVYAFGNRWLHYCVLVGIGMIELCGGFMVVKKHELREA